MSTNWKGYYAEKAVRFAHDPDRSAGQAELIGTIGGITVNPNTPDSVKVDRINHLLSSYFQALVLPEAEARATLVMKGGR